MMIRVALIVIVAIVILSGVSFGATYSGGTGEPNNPYQIATKIDLLAIASDANDYSKCFILTEDIDLDPNLPGGQIFMTAIIAQDTSTNGGFQGTAFTGTFDGNGHKIIHFTINGSSKYLGLFGQIGTIGSVKNLGIENYSASGTSYIGGLAGCNSGGSINNCYSTGTVSGSSYVGGLVGYNTCDINYYHYGSISNCYSTGTVSGYYGDAGGLVGRNWFGTISNCYSTGAVSSASSASYNVGGLAGYNFGSINTCYSTGAASGSYCVGGLVGANEGSSIIKCYSTGEVSGSNYVGGLVGNNPGGTITGSFWDVNTSGQMTSPGGIGKTTVEMQTLSTFISAGWDFLTIWDIVESQTYPFFKNNSNTGTPDDPYRIATKADLLTMAADTSYYSKCFILMADIDLAGQVFTTAIVAPDTSTSSSFQGTFDGNDHKITNFTINGGSNNDFLGLFGQIGNGGLVKNLGIENFTVSSSLISYNIGGLSGGNSGNIIACYSAGVVSGSSNSQYVGGLVGSNSSGTITACHAIGAVSGSQYVGGLVGYNNSGGSIINCYSTGAVSGSQYVGGLVGSNSSGTITACYATGTVSGPQYVGGLVGNSISGTITACYATGAVSGSSNSYCVGGLVGGNGLGSINNCYSTGVVSGSYGVGGLVGRNIKDRGSISNCYSTGAVSGSSDVGGLVGYNNAASIISNSFWDMETSSQPTSAAGTGLSTLQMKQQASFIGWDFTTLWAICDGTNYPRLQWQIPAGDFVCPDGVNFADYSFFAEHWLDTNCAANNNCNGTDLDVSDSVDWTDMMIFCQHWLEGIEQ